MLITKRVVVCISIAFALIVNSLSAQDLKEWSYSLALQAATWGAPLVTMYALRANDAVGPRAKAPPNTIWRMEDISTPSLSRQAGYVTPNVNVIYGFGFMDLRDEPIILEVPDSKGRYYMVEIVDMYTNAFAYIGGRATGYKGGKYALVGPGWTGVLPDGLKRIDCPTPWVLLQPRVHIYDKGKIDLAGARQILAAITPSKSKPAAKYNYPVPLVSNPNLPVSALNFTDPLQFWEILSSALNENPPPQDQIKALLPLFKPLGIELGKQWDRSKLPTLVVDSMRDAARKIGSMLTKLPFGTQYKGAVIPPPTIGNSGTDYLTRAVVARVGLTANIPSEAIYWMYTQDQDGNPLTGGRRYTMTFKEEIPYYAPGFWSITLYSQENNYTIPNPINRYMLGSDSPDLVKNEDGSFTIYIQRDSPGEDKEPNWLPSPNGSFYLIPRSYAPKEEVVELLSDLNSWPIPLVNPA